MPFEKLDLKPGTLKLLKLYNKGLTSSAQEVMVISFTISVTTSIQTCLLGLKSLWG